MKCNIIFLLLALAATAVAASAAAPLQRACAGRIDRLEVFSPQLGDTVVVDTWLPEGYDLTETRFPVVYMHDGQNLFDASTTWNAQSWEMDSVVSLLVARGEIKAPLIVGIHSVDSTRIGDLMPRRAVVDAGLEQAVLNNPMGVTALRGDDYVAFITETLKPLVDSLYRTLPDAANTTVMGSSMGGLMSIYALCERPDVFGNAGCLSTHWVGLDDGYGDFGRAMRDYLDRHLPAAGNHRLYFDRGTETIDAAYGPSEQIMIDLIVSKGYRPGVDLETYVDDGAAHEERFWARRVARPLSFFLTL